MESDRESQVVEEVDATPAEYADEEADEEAEAEAAEVEIANGTQPWTCR